MKPSPPEKQDAQVVDNQRNCPVLFLGSLLPAGRGWSANKAEWDQHRAVLSANVLNALRRNRHTPQTKMQKRIITMICRAGCVDHRATCGQPDAAPRSPPPEDPFDLLTGPFANNFRHQNHCLISTYAPPRTPRPRWT